MTPTVKALVERNRQLFRVQLEEGQDVVAVERLGAQGPSIVKRAWFDAAGAVQVLEPVSEHSICTAAAVDSEEQ